MLNKVHIDLLVLLETHVSSFKADNVIKKLGFQRSHRMEA